ncbi:hypothetical protein SAMN05444411_103294 [Lutibacter oricola]|uniref:Uncharacterized protein n=1 Tax=Lutibacter oricola TaxID=762486 RepID=A0A1H2ZLH1_9FLAO|nr:hypothetical protein [Lutibacter oricola]SDX18215.1 hypothetical protein SAMN05444411_103294 [Lutibacter oricola]
MKLTRKVFIVLNLSLLMLLIVSCGGNSDSIDDEIVVIIEEDEEVVVVEEEEQEPEEAPCTSGKAYAEKEGLVNVEFESLEGISGWNINSDIEGYLGSGYIVWTGAQHFGDPGTAILVYPIKITTPGTYRFMWRSRITKGNNGTEHNDTWLRFADASDFYGKKGDHIVYPKGTGKTPNPNGSSKDGWFKVYMNGANSWKWASNTSDNDGHGIYVKFDEAGVYNMEISVRSSHHAIDRFVLYKNGYGIDNATDENAVLSELICK